MSTFLRPDHEQVLGASWMADTEEEAMDFRRKAVSHALNIHRTVGQRRNPGHSGSWQRGYFDWDEASPNHGQFVLNEGKQGWTHASTWSRGQAWWIYGICLAYYHTRHPELLEAAREAVRYYVDHLPDRYPDEHRREGIFIPAWDFDYAYQVDFETEYDTSAAALAAAGMVRFLAAMDPSDRDYADFVAALQGTLLNLTAAPFFATADYPEMSILRKGAYHHPASLQPSAHYNNGLIWGDHFFIDALLEYRRFRDRPLPSAVAPVVAYDPGRSTLAWNARPDFVYQLEASEDLEHWHETGIPFRASGDGEVIEASADHASSHSFWRLRAWPRPELRR